MIRALLVALISLFAVTTKGHVGSPDLFYSGPVGPYPARITIRMPRVVPGRAEISVRLEKAESVEVSFLPLYGRTAIANAPPPDQGRLVSGETNLYAGELWLMSFGAYSVEVRIKGEKGNGTVQIPLTSVATRQLPMPSMLGKVLSLLACTLVLGAIGIASAAGREAGLAPGQAPGKLERRKGIIAAVTTMLIMTGALFGGRHWWKVEEAGFREHLREGAWPDLNAEVKITEGQRVLRLEIGREAFKSGYNSPLIPDHGKLMHLFLIREGRRDAFAHLHPVRIDGNTFNAALPPLPEGHYTLFCDLTFEGGSSSTATTEVELPALDAAVDTSSVPPSRVDPDDSWASYAVDAVPTKDSNAPVFRLADGTSVAWKTERPVRTRHDASLRFEVTDPTGQPLALEPYMGMLCHAAVLRSDGTIFAHLHPSGNYSMAAQSFFATKLAREASVGADADGATSAATPDHSMHQSHGSESGGSVAPIYLPYEFPEPGDYRIWVQFKTGGRILTGVFDVHVNS